MSGIDLSGVAHGKEDRKAYRPPSITSRPVLVPNLYSISTEPPDPGNPDPELWRGPRRRG